MADTLPSPELGGSAGSLFRINRGQILGRLQRDAAERGYHLYQDRRVMKIVWQGESRQKGSDWKKSAIGLRNS